MISEAWAYFDTLWWISVFRGIVMLAVVLSFNTIADWLRDSLDPKMRSL